MLLSDNGPITSCSQLRFKCLLLSFPGDFKVDSHISGCSSKSIVVLVSLGFSTKLNLLYEFLLCILGSDWHVTGLLAMKPATTRDPI